VSGDLVCHDGDGVRIIRIARPQVHNALNAAIIAALAGAVEAAASTPDIRAVVLTGTGNKAFSAGADLAELRGLSGASAIAYMRTGQDAFRRIEQAPIPVIAAVNGLALGGGCELILASTFAVMSENAALGLPEAGLGLIPGYGGTQRLQRLIGRPCALHAMLSGARIDANRAYVLGLSPIPPTAPEDLLPVAMKLARDIAGKGPGAVRSILRLARIAETASIETALDLETYEAARAIDSAEASEGIGAFLERRPPKFSEVER